MSFTEICYCINTSKDNPLIPYLMFAYDYPIFYKATKNAIKNLSSILEIMVMFSSQLL